ncbi:MAG: hypothetical protein AB7L92_04460 [Alphaproteobacteria bacterium]
MTIKKTAAAFTLSALLASTSAYALEAKTTIDALPDKGAVALTGTVESVDGEKSFTLRDAKGKTIDVEAKDKINLSKGDKINVTGVMESDFLGFGHEIDAATVASVKMPSDHANTTATTRMDKEFGSRMDNERYGSDDNRETASYRGNIDLDAEVDSHQVNNTKAQNQAEMKNEESAIKALPDQGKVTVTGKAESVDPDDRSFTLRDDSGKTIDVHTNDKLAVSEGDSVKVHGLMQDEVAGLGEEIVNAKVTVLSRR